MSDPAETLGTPSSGQVARLPSAEPWTLTDAERARLRASAATSHFAASDTPQESTETTGETSTGPSPDSQTAVTEPAVILDESLILVDPLPEENLPEEGAPVDGVPVDGAPVDEVPVDGVPVDEVPVDGGPMDDVEALPAEGGEIIFMPAVMPEGWEDAVEAVDPIPVDGSSGEDYSGIDVDTTWIATCWRPFPFSGETDDAETLEMRTLIATTGIADASGSGSDSGGLFHQSFQGMPLPVSPILDQENASENRNGTGQAMLYGSFDLGFSNRMAKHLVTADLILMG